MREYETQKVEQKVVTAIVCDCCGEKYSNRGYDDMEVQEFLFVDFIGGYGSIFGDGVKVSADICQRCVKDRLGDILKII